jgi:hypothetical protein
MKTNRKIYQLINLLVVLTAAGVFVYEYRDAQGIFSERIASLAVLVLTVALVHIIKAGRLYLALYGSGITGMDYVKTYCKVTPVGVIFPFKLGEFFRMYCYGILLGNPLKSIVIVLLDRFMDTMALVTAIVLTAVLGGDRMAGIVYVLLVFIVLILILYFAYPGVYRFWKSYLLRAKATEHKLNILRFLERFNAMYSEVEEVTKGRGIILYFLSLIAWGVEIGSLYIRNGSGQTADYLAAAMGSGQSIELKRFVIVSIILLMLMYLIIKLAEAFTGKKDKQ